MLLLLNLDGRRRCASGSRTTYIRRSTSSWWLPRRQTPTHLRRCTSVIWIASIGICYNRLGDRQAAEDATSEAFLKALTHLPNYRSGSFAAWLYAIAHNVVIAHYRKERHSEPLDSADVDSGCGRVAADPLAGHAERAALLESRSQNCPTTNARQSNFPQQAGPMRRSARS